MSVPQDCRYLESHEWHKADGELIIIGITDHAADELTDITYVELPEVGKDVSAGDAIGELESVKATSDFYTGVSGEIAEVNEKLTEAPELINSDAFGEGWIVKIKPKDPSELDNLMSPEEYEKTINDD